MLEEKIKSGVGVASCLLLVEWGFWLVLFLVPGSWFLVPGFWFLVLSSSSFAKATADGWLVVLDSPLL